MNHERDQQALSLLHLRRDNEKAINEARIEQQRWVMELAFHGDYEKYRDDLDSAISAVAKGTNGERADAKLPPFFSSLIEQSVREALKQHSADFPTKVARQNPVEAIPEPSSEIVTIQVYLTC